MTRPDPVADGDLLTSAWLNDLLAAIPQVQTGRVGSGTIAGNTATDVVVQFDKPFSATPTVTATISATSNPQTRYVSVQNVTPTHLTLRFLHTVGSPQSINVHWIAVLP